MLAYTIALLARRMRVELTHNLKKRELLRMPNICVGLLHRFLSQK